MQVSVSPVYSSVAASWEGAKNVLPYEGGNSISINLLYVGKDSVGLPIKQAGLG